MKNLEIKKSQISNSIGSFHSKVDTAEGGIYKMEGQERVSKF